MRKFHFPLFVRLRISSIRRVASACAFTKSLADNNLGVIIPVFRRSFDSIRHRNGMPDIRIPIALRNAFAVVICHAEIPLRNGRLPVSAARRYHFHRLRVIPLNASCR